MKRTPITVLAAAAMIAVSATVASAHVGVDHASGFSHGFLHPVSGLDHVLAMALVGLFAAQLGGRALWLVPTAFISLMVVGGAIGAAGISMPFVELGIGLSVVVLGGVVALGFRPAVAVGMAMVGFFALFHGHAHGAEMPSTAAGVTYGLGFVVATALLHVCGLVPGLIAADRIGSRGLTAIRAAGGLAAVMGIALVSGAV